MSRRPAAPRNPFASPGAAVALAGVLVVLVVATLLASGLLPGLGSSGSSAAPSSAPAAAQGTPSPGASLEPSFVRPTPTPEPTFTSYQVRSGDTLTSIAKAFSTTARSIAWWNRGRYPSLDPQSSLYAPDRVGIGWTLVLIPGVTVDEANPPTPSPGPPTASPRPSATPVAGSPGPTGSASGPATVITAGPRGTTKVALTFDMGGRLDPAVDIVQWLIANRVHATVFPTGKTGSTTTQGTATLGLVAAHPELFDIGNHSWDHPDFTTISAASMAQQLTTTEAAIAPLAGQSTRPWFRPPFGAWNSAVRTAVGAAGWQYLVLWDVDTIDWKPTSDGGPTTQDIVTKVLANAKGGSIVLMHLGGYNTLDALPGVVSGLAARGLTPVTLDEMIGR